MKKKILMLALASTLCISPLSVLANNTTDIKGLENIGYTKNKYDLNMYDYPTAFCAAPDTTIPSIPGTGFPGTGIPTTDFPIPDITIPDITIPDITIPNITIPNIPIPDITIPDITIPNIPIPNPDAPIVTIGESITEKDSYIENSSGLTQLNIATDVGVINVVKSSSENIIINVEKQVTGPTKIDAQQAMDNILVKLQKNGSTFIIKVTTKDGSRDYWEWLRSTYPLMNASINFTVEIPETINSFDIDHNTGSIMLKEISGEMNLNTQTGEIVLENVSLIANSNVTTNTGVIRISGDISNLKGLNVKNGAGSIMLILPKNSQFFLDASTNLGIIRGSFLSTPINTMKSATKQKINNGTIPVKLETGVGDIIVDQL